ncbi:Asp-tRNA(Asn)/Glu-tRNA(Gln) amidotransferase subunit GatB [Candidatus Neomarinimicrobiota bacterium]
MTLKYGPELLEKWEPVIGLEVHAQLGTNTKMFCSCRRIYGAPPNTHTCPVCLGYPGALPVPNARAVHLAITMGLAVGCKINMQTVFARKNYFYPDLTKGYQISQSDNPICEHGRLEVLTESGSEKTIGITRIHMEEDAGKLIHGGTDESYVDFNRCGTPLIEIVSEPDIRSPFEAKRYLERLKQILEFTNVSDADMEKGNLRCDANVSVRPRDQTEFGTRTEMKNLNSFRGVERGIFYEIERQVQLLKDGQTVEQCTLNWDDAAGQTRLLRSKEEADDYRYFPEPDLVPVVITEDEVGAINAELPELPAALETRFAKNYGLRNDDIKVLTRSRDMAEYFEAVVSGGADPKIASQWVLGDVLRMINEEQEEIGAFPVSPKALAELIELVEGGVINRNTGKAVFNSMLLEDLSARELVNRDKLAQVSDSSAVDKSVQQVIEAHPQEYMRYVNGEKKLFGFFMGQVMTATRGKGDPAVVRQALQKVLDGQA